MRQLELLEDGRTDLPTVPAVSVCAALEAGDETALAGDPFCCVAGAPFGGLEPSVDRCSVHAMANGLKTSRVAGRIFGGLPHI